MLSTSTTPGGGAHAIVNEFVDFQGLKNIHTNIKETHLKDMYVQVQELVQATAIIAVRPEHIIGLIFLFREDEIVDGVFPCEGIEISFLLRYRMVNSSLHLIPTQQCLPFPCSYDTYHLS